MNANLMPDGNTAALHEEMRREDAFEQKLARLRAEYPLEEFKADAWEHAFDETGYELLTSLAMDIPHTVLQILLLGAEVNHPNKMPDINAEYAKRTVRTYIFNWIEREQKRLQAKAIENAS